MNIETTNRYLELSLFNNSKNETVKSVLEYKAGDLTEDYNYTKLNIWKFNIVCRNFPTVLFPIRDPKFNSVYKPYVPPGATLADIFYENAPMASFATYYLTDWIITMKYKTSHVPTGQYYLSRFVQFLKPKSQGPAVVEFDDNGDITERFMLKDRTKFFWGDSTQLCNMVNEALNGFRSYSGLSHDDFLFVKNGEHWSILSKVSLDIEKIYLNDTMRKFFDFPYDYDTGITIQKMQITTINDIDYYVVNTIKTNTYLFPFRNITFIFDNNLNVFPQYIVDNNTANNSCPSENILTRFTLNITDINQIGNVIEYHTESKDRALSLNNSAMGPFKIYCYLQTAQRNLFELELEQHDEINMLLMIS